MVGNGGWDRHHVNIYQDSTCCHLDYWTYLSYDTVILGHFVNIYMVFENNMTNTYCLESGAIMLYVGKPHLRIYWTCLRGGLLLWYISQDKMAPSTKWKPVVCWYMSTLFLCKLIFSAILDVTDHINGKSLIEQGHLHRNTSFDTNKKKSLPLFYLRGRP